MELKTKSVTTSIFVFLLLLILTQNSFCQQEEKTNTSETLFKYAMGKLQAIQGVLWLYRTAYNKNPSSDLEIKNFVKITKIDYYDPFNSIEYKPNTSGEKDDIIVHFMLKTNSNLDHNLLDSLGVEIEGDANLSFKSMKSSIAYIHGENIFGKFIEKEKLRILLKITPITI